MGNQLAGIAPSQILSVESYFSDIHDFEYDKSLGSTRFFKVARAKHREGLVVVKVFAIQDPTLPLTSYKQELEELKIRLHSAQNCLPFQKAAEKASEKAAMLFRQYVRDNLYDRISTRPFLNNIEKRWVAFQILTAVDQAHKSGVRHGDIKTENVMVTSWNWVLLTDFASFKPTYLPEDNPADFNYFFDTSRRRTCYIAPERFVDGGLFATELEYMRDPSTPLVDLNSNQRTRGELKRAMDIFSAGCVIAELFTEGVPLFDLSQLLAYRNGQFFPEQVLSKIEDRSIRELVTQMIHREPDKRLEAEDYLKQQRGNAFPEIFYTFLQPYMAQFAKETFLSADERILVIRKDLDNIIHNLCGHDLLEKADGEPKENGLVILVSVITSCLQTLKYCDSKLAALELILHLAPRLSVEILLDRITPYLLHFSNDSVPRVRAEALRTLTKVLALVKEVPRNDVNIYPEYILPGIAHLAQDDATIVRLAYAENIALLAETALRFLELVQLKNLNMENDPNSEEIDEVTHPNGNYDTELQALHEMVQQKVVTLLSDPENIVKQTLMENGITRLCVFFGRQKANDVLLSHMITFLNDKNDWHLRGAFFDSIVGVAAYVGWQSSSILKPLLQQGLSDAEEFVIVKALNALTCMCQLGLLQKPHVYEFASDIGCVIAELFTEGVPLFDLSQLLAYRNGQFFPEQVLSKIEDRSIRELVTQMIHREPDKRLEAEDYLKQQRGNAFPEIFYTFLQPYMAQFAKETFLSADERILVIRKDLDNIIHNLCGHDLLEKADGEPKENGLVILVSVITSCLQTLKYCDSKLAALELILHLAPRLSVEILLDRITPYLLHFSNDSVPRVRAEALRTLTKVLALVKEVPRNDVNIYPEYILPGIAHLAQDDATIVRLAYAENIALLAETALRFLELVQLKNLNMENDPNSEEIDEVTHPNGNYDTELQALHEMVQQKVVTLLSDPENIVKQTLMENGITRLCVFFGRQKANDVLLSHMITFLNDKNDWHLRGAFFDSIVGVAAYVGWQSSSILKPLLQQGLSDAEEFVIVKALNALTCMCQLGLLQKPHVYEFASDIAPFLCHPNLWIRYGAVGFITVVAHQISTADVYCKLMPYLDPYITQPIIQIERKLVLLSVLKEPVSRSIFDYALRSKDITSLFRHLHMRQKKRNGSLPDCPPPEDPAIAQLLKKLLSQGMTEEEEDKLLALKDFMMKSNKAKANIVDQSHLHDSSQKGVIDLAALGITGRQVDLVKTKQEPDDKRARKHVKQDSNVNEEWKSMFGSLEPPSMQQALPKGSDQEVVPAGKPPRSESSAAVCVPLSTSPQIPEVTNVQNRKPTIQVLSSTILPSTYQIRITTCKTELQQLIQQKREQCNAERIAKQMMENAEWESKPPPPGWRPKGLLVAHLHEHKSAVNRIRVSDEHSLFATCSNDGTVKIWNSQKMEGKTTTTRSILTYSRVGGRVKTLTFCQGSHYLAVASDNGAVQLLAIEASKLPKSPKIHPLQSRVLDQKEDGCVVDLHHFSSGAQSVLAYATVNGALVGWDLRSSSNAWTLRHDLKAGLITSFAVDIHQCWLCIGTSSGTMACWDMRFQLPISSHCHPSRARVRRLSMHPLYQSWVIAAVQGNNEVSMWDMETGDRRFTLWASSAPPLSELQPSSHSVHGLYCSPADGNPILLTAGSDMKIRFWDLAYPERSYIVAGSAGSPSVSYYRKVIEGTEVVQEIQNKQKVGPSDDGPRRGPESLPVGHHDIITDVATFQTTQGFIVTASRDGIVKVWK